MELKGKITIFPETKEGKNDKGEAVKFIVCRGTISSKNESGEYVNKSVSVKFAGSNFPKDKVNKLNPEKCYQLDIEEGFLGVTERVTSTGTKKDLEIVVLKGKLANPKDVKRPEAPAETKNDDLPF